MPPRKRYQVKNIEVCHLIKKVHDFFITEKKRGPLYVNSPILRLKMATGISISSLRNHMRRCDPVHQLVEDLSKKKEGKKPGTKPKLDTFGEEVLQSKICQMQRDGEFVSVRRLTAKLKENDIDVSSSTVGRTVKRIGYRFHKHGSKKKSSKEENEIAAKRHNYLHNIRKNRQQGCEVVNIDEKWSNAKQISTGDWLFVPSSSNSTSENTDNVDKNVTQIEDSDIPNSNEASDPELNCKICKNSEPPNPPKHIKWYQCKICLKWIHNKCSTKKLLNSNKCSFCLDIDVSLDVMPNSHSATIS